MIKIRKKYIVFLTDGQDNVTEETFYDRMYLGDIYEEIVYKND